MYVCYLVDLTSWRLKIAADRSCDETAGECDIETVDKVSLSQQQQQQQQPYDGGILTIGCCGL